MLFEEAEKYVLEIPKFTKKNGLENTKALLCELQYPQKNKKIVHVAGSNGKGSVCFFTASMLMEAGKTVGLFTSPHLVKITERFQVNHEEMSPSEFVECFLIVKKAVENIMKKGYAHPTFFEMIFAIGMVYFQRQDVDYIVLETGLGGRLDATNAIETPLVTAITSISLDHTEYLGDTIEKIAKEKAGIAKKTAKMFVGVNPPSVVRVIEDKTRQLGCEILKVSEKDYEISEKNNKHIDFFLNIKYYGYVKVSMPYRALYQVENGVLAIRIVEYLLEKENGNQKDSEQGIEILSEKIAKKENRLTLEMIQEAFQKRQWAGRMEQVLPDIYLDGAHNEGGVRAFVQTAKELTQNRQCVLLFGAVREKDYQDMIESIARGLPCSEVVVTNLDTPRSLDVEELAKTFSKSTECEIIKCANASEGWKRALELKTEEKVLFCIGSLYLVGEIKAILGE